jgi:hypothetical protein
MSIENRFDDLSEDLQNKIKNKIIKFPDNPVSFGKFFQLNNEFFQLNVLNKEKWAGCTFTLTGDSSYPRYNTRTLYIDYLGDRKYNQWSFNYPYKSNYKFNLFDFKDINTLREKFDLTDSKFQYIENFRQDDGGGQAPRFQIITKLKIEKDGQEIFTAQKNLVGGRKEYIKKEILGKLRCIYKIHGSRKEHIKYKGMLITVLDYKKLMKRM